MPKWSAGASATSTYWLPVKSSAPATSPATGTGPPWCVPFFSPARSSELVPEVSSSGHQATRSEGRNTQPAAGPPLMRPGQVSGQLVTPSPSGSLVSGSVLTQCSTSSHVSVVHGLPSAQLLGGPVQTPCWHASGVVQKNPSLHDVPFGNGGFEHAPVVVSHVPTP